jgi:Delta7-sterol 5-desaturase
MDAALEILDPLVFDRVYAYFVPSVPTIHNATASYPGQPSSPALDTSYLASLDGHGDDLSFGSAWPRDSILRQTISILFVTQLGASALYLIFSALSYYLIFDRRLEYHPRFLKNQVRQEIATSFYAIPWINLLTMPWFLAEVRGKSLLYSNIDDYGWSWMAISAVLFMVWNDFFIYWIHRLEHHPSIYKYIHKPHHKWISMSCSHALVTLLPTWNIHANRI